MKRYSAGYTYVEMTIVIAIFSVLLVIIGSIYMIFTKAQTKNNNTLSLVNDGRYLLEVMTRQIRTSALDYSAYLLPVNQPQTELNLITVDDQKIIFRKVTAGCALASDSCLEIIKEGQANILSAGAVNVLNLFFYILPDLDPNHITDGTYDASSQPQVVISLGLQSVDDPAIILNFQTTVSSKRYLR